MAGHANREYIVVDITARHRPMKLKGSKLIPGTDNFYVWEFACSDGTQIVLYDPWIMRMLQAIRDDYGAVEIISGVRSIQYNDDVGGADDSDHIYGWGVDFRVVSLMSRGIPRMLEIVQKYTGNQCAIGKYSTWIHLGNREKEVSWNG